MYRHALKRANQSKITTMYVDRAGSELCTYVGWLLGAMWRVWSGSQDSCSCGGKMEVEQSNIESKLNFTVLRNLNCEGKCANSANKQGIGLWCAEARA